MTRSGGAPLSAVGRTVLALLGFAARRLRSNPIHALTTLLGLSLTVGVITAVPLFADGMSTRLLREHLRASPGPLDLGVLIEHGASQLPEDPSTTLAEYRQADQILSQTIAANLAVSPDGIVRFVRSDNRHLLFTSDDPGTPLREGVPWGGLGAISDLAANVEMLEGRAAAADVFTLRLPSGALVPLVEAVASTDMLDAGGLVVGDQVQLRFGDPRALGTPQAIVAVDIVGALRAQRVGSTVLARGRRGAHAAHAVHPAVGVSQRPAVQISKRDPSAPVRPRGLVRPAGRRRAPGGVRRSDARRASPPCESWPSGSCPTRR